MPEQTYIKAFQVTKSYDQRYLKNFFLVFVFFITIQISENCPILLKIESSIQRTITSQSEKDL